MAKGRRSTRSKRGSALRHWPASVTVAIPDPGPAPELPPLEALAGKARQRPGKDMPK